MGERAPEPANDGKLASKSDYFPDPALRDRGFDDIAPPRVI
jgi:hypothetical protein